MNDTNGQVPYRRPGTGIRPLADRHQWLQLALGRVCSACLMVQPRDEYSDAVPCEPTLQFAGAK